MLASLGCRCCEQDQDGTQIVLTPVEEKTDYGHGGGDFVVHQSSAAPDHHSVEPASAEPAGTLGPAAPPKEAESSAVAQSNAQTERKPVSTELAASVEREKQLLQELVKAFVKRAVKGIGCKYIDPASGESRPGKYFIDRRLCELSIKVPEAGSAAAVNDMYPIGQLADVAQKEMASKVLAPTAVPEDSVPKLIAIVDGDRKLFIVEASVEDAENFAVCMRVLRVYCRQQAQAQNK